MARLGKVGLWLVALLVAVPVVRALASLDQICGVFLTAGLVGRILGLAEASSACCGS